MNNILTLSRLTIREAFARKVFVMFFGVSSFMLLVFAILFGAISIDDFVVLVDSQEGVPFDLITKVVEFFKMFIIIPLFGGGLFLAIFTTSSFIPNMLEKGSIDLLLSKPVSRAQVIWGKFFGGTFVVFVNIAYLVIGIWLLIGIKFGVWDAQFLITILTITFTFAVLYAFMILIGIITRSSILAMMFSYLIFFILSPVLAARESLFEFIDSKVAQYLIDGLYYILPNTSELGEMTTNFAQGAAILNYEPAISAFIFMILSLTFSIIIFNKKDY